MRRTKKWTRRQRYNQPMPSPGTTNLRVFCPKCGRVADIGADPEYAWGGMGELDLMIAGMMSRYRCTRCGGLGLRLVGDPPAESGDAGQLDNAG